jgi:CMP-N,N'-diacetyllegionaminic acid synthase
MKDVIYINKTIAIIPARKGSKSIKNKNRLKINGQNLVDRTLEFCKKSKCFDYICLTTDDNFFLKNKKKIFIIKRLKKISSNKTSLNKVVMDVLKQFKNKYNFLPENICLLQPTSPFRDYKNFKHEFRKLKKFERVFSISKIDDTISNIFYFEKKRKIFFKKKRIDNKQQDKKIFHLDGNFFIFKTKLFLKNRNIFNKNFYGSKNIFPFNIEIDSWNQYILARNVQKVYKLK